ncbi:TetR/AcrR family transcriptional regulator [Labedaea rhizosphaerae]|nr:TetR/AcrR family transcriptional regulator [Labedaea rhizosphaerae]
MSEDRRLLRGAQSRQAIVRHGVDLASLEGLDGLSFGRLATDLGISKSGIQTLFGTKEQLQLAVAEAARAAFETAVITPTGHHPHGAVRLRALVEKWLVYAEEPLFPGGCFWAANLPVFDSRPGPVRDALAQHQRDWRLLLATQLRHAGSSADAELTAFQLDAVLMAANTALRLDDNSAVRRVHRIVDTLLAPA